MSTRKEYPISAHVERVLCAAGYFSPRTLRKALAGDRVQEMVRARIENTLRAHGLEDLLPLGGGPAEQDRDTGSQP